MRFGMRKVIEDRDEMDEFIQMAIAGDLLERDAASIAKGPGPGE